MDGISNQSSNSPRLRELSPPPLIFSHGMPLASLSRLNCGIPYPPPNVTPTLAPSRAYVTSQSSTSAPPLTASIPSMPSRSHSITSPSKDASTSLPHLTASSTVHVIPISHKTSTARSALAVGHVTFSNLKPLPLIRAHALQKGDVLAVARIAAITAAKKTSDWIPLCHSGVPIEGIRVRVEVVDGHGGKEEITTSTTITSLSQTNPTPTFATTSTTTTTPPLSSAHQSPPSSTSLETNNENPDREESQVHKHEQEFFRTPLPPYGGVRISVRVDTTAKTGVEMEALVGVVGAGLSVVDMCKAVDRGLTLEGVRVVWKRGGRSGEWGVWNGKGEGEGG